MSKYTTEDLSDYLGRILEDPDSLNWLAAERLDYINQAQRFIQSILIGVHREGVSIEYFTETLLDKDEFSYLKTITCPLDFEIDIEARFEEKAAPFNIVSKRMILEDVDEDRVCFYASKLTSPVPDSGNSGTDEFAVWDGGFSGSVETSYVIELLSGTTFRWSDAGGASWDGTLTITGEWQTLNNGVRVKFASTSGYTTGDKWTFTGYHDREVAIMRGNFTVTYNVILTSTKRLTDFTAINATTYLPFERYYDAFQLFCTEMCRSRNEENPRLDTIVFSPVRKRVFELAGLAGAGRDVRNVPGATYEDYI